MIGVNLNGTSGLSICEKNKTFDGHERTGFTAWTKEKYHFRQDMMEGKSKKSYVYNTMEVVRDSMNRAASREEFENYFQKKDTMLTGRISTST